MSPLQWPLRPNLVVFFWGHRLFFPKKISILYLYFGSISIIIVFFLKSQTETVEKFSMSHNSVAWCLSMTNEHVSPYFSATTMSISNKNEHMRDEIYENKRGRTKPKVHFYEKTIARESAISSNPQEAVAGFWVTKPAPDFDGHFCQGIRKGARAGYPCLGNAERPTPGRVVIKSISSPRLPNLS